MNRKQNTIKVERSVLHSVEASMKKAKVVYLTKEGKAVLEQNK